jgi:hypothetical protein
MTRIPRPAGCPGHPFAHCRTRALRRPGAQCRAPRNSAAPPTRKHLVDGGVRRRSADAAITAAAAMPISRPAVPRHLRLPKDAGTVAEQARRHDDRPSGDHRSPGCVVGGRIYERTADGREQIGGRIYTARCTYFEKTLPVETPSGQLRRRRPPASTEPAGPRLPVSAGGRRRRRACEPRRHGPTSRGSCRTYLS